MKNLCCKKYYGMVSVVSLLALAGCSAPPQSAAELRQWGKEGKLFLSNETITVKQPYQKVVEAFKQRAPACLDVTINYRSRVGMQTSWGSLIWKSHVTANDKHMECVLQLNATGGDSAFAYPNKDGHYFFLVDAYPIDQGSTRIVLTKGPSMNESLLQSARNWASGENMGCPDLSKFRN